MADKLYFKGLEAYLGGSDAWVTNTHSAALLDLTVSSVGVRLIASSTNATPIVITTAVAHGFATGDLVSITGHTTNTAANGIWVIAAASASVFSLTDPILATNAVGNGVGGATGRAVNLGVTAQNYSDVIAGLIGAKVALTSPTITNGVANAANVTFTAVSGNPVQAVVLFRDTGTTTTSTLIAQIDGRQIVTCAATTASTAVSLPVERLRGGIPNGTVLAFSNGASATLSALANAGDRTLTVTSTAATITAGNRADAPITGAGLPVTPNGGNITVTWDAGANRIFSL